MSCLHSRPQDVDRLALGTKNVQAYEMTMMGKHVILYDTPGFDDSEGRDIQFFETIAQHLYDSFTSKQLLNGAIFMQPMTDLRVKESENIRTELFKQIVGEEAYDHVVIATTMWNNVSSDFGEQSEGNRTNADGVWTDMLEEATLIRFHNDQDSAQAIVRHFLNKPKVTMKLQKEISEKKGKVCETSAGRWVEESIGRRVKDIEEKMGRFGATAALKRSLEKFKGALARLKKLIVRPLPWS